MRIGIAQLNPTVGDVAGNTRLVLDAIEQARTGGAELLVTSELVLIGYPPRDLLFRRGVVEACEEAVREIARHSGQMTVLVGHPSRVAGGSRPFRNSVSAMRDGRVLAVYDKRLLPGYDVFDEDRYFDPGERVCIVEVAGSRIGVLVCEDMWRARDVTAEREYPVEPAIETAKAGCDVLAVLNGSPFVVGKWQRHIEQLADTARAVRTPIVSVNQVGGNDDLIFDGRSVVISAEGEFVAVSPSWEQAVTVEVVESTALTRGPITISADPMDEIFNALVLGVRDYCRKTGHRRAWVGLSGGIDSALTAVVAAAALGPQNVIGVLMPSRYTSGPSREDALALIDAVGMTDWREISILEMHKAGQDAIAAGLGAPPAGIADENLQARQRGLVLMTLSNSEGGLVLATGNKSELACGYCTLYGDMCGALAVLGDVTKTRVYELARWINANFAACGWGSEDPLRFAHPPIPERSITKPPTAELKADQTDQDTLPPYELLDPVIERFIELEQSPQQIIEECELPEPEIRRVLRMIDQAQYKRDQAAIVLKVTGRTFGRGRPWPAAAKVETGNLRADLHEGPPSVSQGPSEILRKPRA